MPLDSLRALIAETRLPVPPGLPPIAAGLFGYLGYDMVRQIEQLPEKNPDVLGIPDAVLTAPHADGGVRPCARHADACARRSGRAGLDARRRAGSRRRRGWTRRRQRWTVRCPRRAARPALPKLARARAAISPRPATSRRSSARRNTSAPATASRSCRRQRFSVPFALPPFSLYRALRRINPAPFLLFVDFGGFARWAPPARKSWCGCRDNTVTVRPLAGTRRRGATPEEDRALEAELLADPKERAEHLMLLDLGRNDVGRVAAIGSVKVTAQFQVERYSQVMHIGSEVSGPAARRAGCARCAIAPASRPGR